MPKVLYPQSFPDYLGPQNCAGETFNPNIYGPQGVYAYGLSLQDAMLLIWRIKNFNLTLPGGLGSAQTTNTATTEDEIYCFPFMAIEGTTQYSNPPGSDPRVSAQFDLGFDAPTYSYEDLYYPSFSMSYRYNETAGDGETISAIQADSGYTGSPAFTFQLPVLNSSLPPITMRASIYEGSPLLPASFSVSEYWSYGGTYNTSNGTAL